MDTSDDPMIPQSLVARNIGIIFFRQTNPHPERSADVGKSKAEFLEILARNPGALERVERFIHPPWYRRGGEAWDAIKHLWHHDYLPGPEGKTMCTYCGHVKGDAPEREKPNAEQ